MKFDDILENHVGEFGPYQKRIYLLLCLIAAHGAYFTFFPVFILATPEHRCKLDDLPNDTYEIQSPYHESLINLSVPWEKSSFGHWKMSQCLLYDTASNVSHSNVSRQGNGYEVLRSEVNSSKSACDSWVFDKSEFTSTAITTFDIVCDDRVLESHFKMISFLGGLCGPVINGVLSDLFGRKKVFMGCLTSFLVAMVFLIFSPVYSLFLAMRFFQGLAGTSIFMICFILVMELVGPHYRIMAGIVIELFWCAGLFILVAAAYFIRHWTYLLIALCSPTVFIFSYFCLIPESPRWLMSQGRVKEAEVILRRIAKSSKNELPENLVEQAKKEEEKDQKKQKESGQFWRLFMNRTLCIRTIVFMINRIAVNMSYYGISLNIEQLTGNLYMDFTLSSVMETIGNLGIILLMNRLGRKPLYCGSMIIASFGFLISTLPIFFGDENDTTWSMVFVMVSKCGISAAFAIVYVYGSELFPTSLRNSAMGLCLCVEFIGGVLSPYLFDIGHLVGGRAGLAFPWIVFGVFTLVAACLALIFPETRNAPLPETVEDAAKFGHEQVV